MQIEPRIVARAGQPYVAVRRQVTMDTIATAADLIPGLFGWLAARGIPPAGAPFLKYNVIDMARRLEVEAGVPVAAPVDGDDEVLAGTLPAGRYVSVAYLGHTNPAEVPDPDEWETELAFRLAG